MKSFWDWLIFSDAGTSVRVVVGVSLFVLLAAWDIRHKGRQSQRWREYLFLLASVAVALCYGVINDQITVTISWEYFFYGKELIDVLGMKVPPDEGPLRWQAGLVGIKATWTVGLLFGVAVLFANNPRKSRPQLPYRTLYRLLAWPLAMAALGGILGAMAAQFGSFAQLRDVIPWFWRPDRFVMVYGIHLGGYIGAAGGVLLVIGWILRRRKRTLQEAETVERPQ